MEPENYTWCFPIVVAIGAVLFAVLLVGLAC